MSRWLGRSQTQLRHEMRRRSRSRTLGSDDVWHALSLDLHFPKIMLTRQSFSDFDVFANRVLNVSTRPLLPWRLVTNNQADRGQEMLYPSSVFIKATGYFIRVTVTC